VRAFGQLRDKAVARRSSVVPGVAAARRVDPFEEGACRTGGPQLHAGQRAVGRHFLQCVRLGHSVAAPSRAGQPASVMLCMGAAGCGKSTVIHEILAQVADERLGAVSVTGYTGVSCAPFLSPTLLTLFNLSALHIRDTDPSGIELARFADRFRLATGHSVVDLAGLIIDEVSFVQADVLGRASRLLQHARDRVGEPMGGVALMLTGHLAQLPPVNASGTWFMDMLNEDRRERGDSGVPPRGGREQSRNFQEGVALLRSAQRFELTHNYRAHLDPPYQPTH
jgi:hypothetical protein